jgi:hypothetical protein
LNFTDEIKSHLSDYKLKKLRVTENGVWRQNKRTYPHILPMGKRELNLLENYREEISKYIHDKNIHLHQDFHHLNSSQAACFNFFYPLIQENQIHLLLEILQIQNEVIQYCEFEKVMSRREGTNFDFYIKLKSGKQLFFEVKYSEHEFGKVLPSEKYQKKYNEIYKERLKGKIRAGMNEYEELVKNDQLLRNISYIDSNHENLVIFICPKENVKLYQEFDYVFNHIVEPSLQKNVRFITWEEILNELTHLLQSTSPVPVRLKNHYIQFKEKYMV